MEEVEEIQVERTWENLPPQTVIGIMKYLKLTDLLKYCRSNKWYHELATSNEVWKHRCLHLKRDILFLTISQAHLPTWLERFDELQNDAFILKPAANFYFVEFMQIWCMFPHAWKRGNQIVNTASLRFDMKDSVDELPNPDIVLRTDNGDTIPLGFAKDTYLNWRDYFEIVTLPTFWLHNRLNGVYEIKRNTLREPIFFQLPFSNVISGVENNRIITAKQVGKASFFLSNKKLQKRIDNLKKISFGVAVVSLTAAIGVGILDAFTTQRVPYHIISNTFLKDDTCDVVYPTMEKLLDPEFQGSLIHTFDTSKLAQTQLASIALGTTTIVANQLFDAFNTISTALGLSSLLAYDTVSFNHPNNVEDFSIFITTENDIQNYHCTVMQAGLDRADEYPAYWIHDVDESYDPIGLQICSTCQSKPSEIQFEGFQSLGSFCGFECASKAWHRK